MKVCTKCITPETHDSISFDGDGVCSVCRQVERKHTEIDWAERRKMLDGIIEQYRGRGVYDCIVPFSGGKDSTFQLYYVVKELGLKPLVVRYDHWGFRPLTYKNNSKTFAELGVDVIQFTSNKKLVKALMLEALERTGDFCWYCHTGVYAHTLQIAVKYDVPLIIWGEASAEYTSNFSFEDLRQVDEAHFEQLVSLGVSADDMHERLKGQFDRRGFYAFEYPSKEDLHDKLKVCPISLGNYIKWDTLSNAETIAKELGWQGHGCEGIPPAYWYEKIECKHQGVRDYIRYLRRGYGRTNHLASIDIRAGRLSRDEAVQITEQYDGKRPKGLDYLLKFWNISEDEFNDMVKKHVVSPWQMPTCPDDAPPYDYDKW